jgi:superfamily II DNA or RNA helicase
MILFQFVEKHGEVLFKMIEKEARVPVLFVAGKTPKDEREMIRKFVNSQTDSITVASSGVFSMGTNIPNLNNMIFSSPAKARIKILQSIGRTLRRTVSKSKAVLYDIADDLSWKGKTNYTLKHFVERIKLYNQELFPYRIYKVDL